VYLAERMEEAIKLSDDYAPEQAKDADYFTDNLTNYGSLFIGEETW